MGFKKNTVTSVINYKGEKYYLGFGFDKTMDLEKLEKKYDVLKRSFILTISKLWKENPL